MLESEKKTHTLVSFFSTQFENSLETYTFSARKQVLISFAFSLICLLYIPCRLSISRESVTFNLKRDFNKRFKQPNSRGCFLSFYQSCRRRVARKADPQPAHPPPLSSIWFLSRLFFAIFYCKITNHTLIFVNMHYVFYCLLYYKDIAYMLRDPKNSIASWPHPWFWNLF